MLKRIKRFSPHQTARTLAIVYFPLGVLMALFMSLDRVVPVAGRPPVPVWVLVAMPFLYSAVSYVAVAFFCVIYNACSRWMGGIEIELADAPARPGE